MYDEARRHKEIKRQLESMRLERERQDRELADLRREHDVDEAALGAAEIPEALERLFDVATKAEAPKPRPRVAPIALRV